MIYWLAVLALVIGAHLASRWFLFSLLPWPVLAAVIVTATGQQRWKLLIVLAVVAELFSSLPAGTVTVAVLIPLIFQSFVWRKQYEFSLTWGIFILILSTLPILVLVIGHLIAIQPASWAMAWQAIPTMVGVMVAAITIASGGAAIVWYELVAPFRRERTVPRFKQL